MILEMFSDSFGENNVLKNNFLRIFISIADN